jgi:hypothetical protein
MISGINNCLDNCCTTNSNNCQVFSWGFIAISVHFCHKAICYDKTQYVQQHNSNILYPKNHHQSRHSRENCNKCDTKINSKTISK